MFLGKDIVAVDSPLGRLGLTVCYDLRFPELYQQLRFQHDAQVWVDSLALWLIDNFVLNLTLANLQVLLVPSAFTKVTGQAHWEILLRARAIETQCYVWTCFHLQYQNNFVRTFVVKSSPLTSPSRMLCCPLLLQFENDCWMNHQVIAAAQAGKNNDKRESYGDSLIIDPWGTVVGRLPGEN
jgi:predicted amidohydrolase